MMTINFSSAGGGWSEYVTERNAQNPRDKTKIEVIEGDFEFGDKLCKANKYKESYYRIVLAFKGKPSKEVMLKAYEEFKKKWFVGLNKNEYHIDSIFHFDTENYHIHIRVPKQNLLTNTHLQLYMHSIDMPRKQLLQDYISLKYDLPIAREKKKQLIQKNKKVEYIKSWREKNKLPPFNFTKRKDRQIQETKIFVYLKSGYDNKAFTSINDVKEELKKNGLKIAKADYDRTAQAHYITVQDSKGKKLKLRGELFNPATYHKEDKSIEVTTTPEVRLKQVKRELRLANEARYRKCQKLFDKQRAKANIENQQIKNKGNLNELTKPQHTRARSISKPDIEKPANAKHIHDMPILSEISMVRPRRNQMLLPSDEQSYLYRGRATDRRVRRTNTSTSRTESPSRGKLNDSTRADAERSPRERLIKEYEARSRAIEATRQARERVLEEFRNANSDIQSRHRSNTEDICREYEQQHSKFAKELFGAIRTAINNTKEFITKLFRVEKTATTVEEKVKPTEATQSPLTTEEVPLNKEGLEEEWGKLVENSEKKLTNNNPKLS